MIIVIASRAFFPPDRMPTLDSPIGSELPLIMQDLSAPAQSRTLRGLDRTVKARAALQREVSGILGDNALETRCAPV